MTAIDTGTEDLRAEIDSGVAVITMNRPDRRNAFSQAMVSALGAVLARVETDDAVGCVVLTGAGGAFCAGGDVKSMAARPAHGNGTGIDAVAWAATAAELGAGEILLNSMDADGTKDGFDLELIRLVRAAVTVPVIASGGAGRAQHFPAAVAAGADAVLAASVFHFGQLTVGAVKAELAAACLPVRA